MIGLQAALEQENAARCSLASDVSAAESAARTASSERDARARELASARAALHETSEKLAAASAERDMYYSRVSECDGLNGFLMVLLVVQCGILERKWVG